MTAPGRHLRKGLRPRKLASRSQAKSSALDTSAANVAKWLIPSASALFIVIGYVIRAAHVSLLGNDFREVIPENYPAHAADFFRELATVLFDFGAAFFAGRISASVHSSLEIGTLGALVAVCIWFAARPKDARLRAWCLGAALVFAVGSKFVLFDAPLALIEGVAVAGDGIDNPEHAEPAKNLLGTQRFIAERSRAVWAEMKCRRFGAPIHRVAQLAYSRSDREKVASAPCTKDDSARDEFVLQLVATGVIVALAWFALRSNRRALNILGVFSAIYCLTLPYAYGKLLKPTIFQYGRIEFATSVDKIVQEKLGFTGINAMVLGSGQGGLSFLVMHYDSCTDPVGPIGGEARQSDASYSVAKIWTVSASQILAVREIYREDIIRWKLLKEQRCPEARPPFM